MDRKIIDLYQWIVDTSEKKPAWLATQAIIASTMTDLIARLLTWKGDGGDIALTVLNLAVGALLVFTARNEAVFKTLGESVLIRMFFLGILAAQIFTVLMLPSGKTVLNTISSLLLMSYYYFAACEAPRPKKRKQVVLKTA